MKSSSARYVLGFALVIVCTALAYAPALQGPLFFDDLSSLSQNPIVQIDGRDFDAWRTAVYSSDAGPLHRPVTMLTFAANYAISGSFSPLTLKLVNLTIHILLAALVYALALAIFSAPVFSQWTSRRIKLAAFAAAALWVLHPLHVSTVMYAVQRMAQLSTLFTVLGLYVFIRYRLEWAAKGATTGAIVACVLWLMLITVIATLSKENGALLPWLVAVFEVCLFRGQWRGTQSRLLYRVGLIALCFPLVLLALIFLVTPETFTSGYKLRDFTLIERLLTQLRILWHYMGWFFLPDIRSMGFHHDDIKVSQSLFQPGITLVALCAWVSLWVAALGLRRRYPLLLFALLFFFVAHIMESSVLALEMVFEHRTYLPSIGLCLLVGGGVSYGENWSRRVGSWFPMGLVVIFVLGPLLGLLFTRAQIWSDQTTLSYVNVVNHPASPRAHFFYADAQMASYQERRERGQINTKEDRGKNKALIVTARKHFLRMNEEKPEDATALVNLLYIDSYYFPGLPGQPDWYDLLQSSLKRSVLHASDLSAVSSLVHCVGNGGCIVSATKVDAMLDRLIAQNPREVWLLLSKYQLQVAENASVQQRILLLEQAAQIAPNNPSVEQHLIIERGRVGDVAGMYAAMQYWMMHDPKRLSMRSMKPMFAVEHHPETSLTPLESNRSE